MVLADAGHMHCTSNHMSAVAVDAGVAGVVAVAVAVAVAVDAAVVVLVGNNSVAAIVVLSGRFGHALFGRFALLSGRMLGRRMVCSKGN
jgi:uncharacterized protein (DUF1786 family)